MSILVDWPTTQTTMAALESDRPVSGQKGYEVKTLNNTDASSLQKNVPDVEKFGDPDRFVLICKASSERERWMRSTKAMKLPTGCLVQVSTHQMNDDGSFHSVAEALTFVPGVTLKGRDGRIGFEVLGKEGLTAR